MLTSLSNYSLKTGDVLEELLKLKNNFFDFAITSPPYNIGKSYEKKSSLESYMNWQKEVIFLLSSKLKDNGSICWQVGNYIEKGEVFPLDFYFYPIFKELGFKLRNRIVWHFNHGLHCKNRLSGRYETLLWFTKSDTYTFNLDNIRVPSKYPNKRHYKGKNKGLPSGNPKGKNPSDFWEDIIKQELECGIFDIPNVKSNHPEKEEHPCQYPIELAERCILAFTNQDDFVLDPFGGTGSTLIACLKNHRNCISIDKSQEYNNIAQKRIDMLENGELKTRKIGTSIHKPKENSKLTLFPSEWLEK